MEIKTTLNIWKIKYNKFQDGISTKKWVAVDDMIKCIDDTYKDLDMGKTIPIFIQRLKEKLNTGYSKEVKK